MYISMIVKKIDFMKIQHTYYRVIARDLPKNSF